MRLKKRLTYLIFSLVLLNSCEEEPGKKSMEVTATAYNSVPEQTSKVGGGVLTAWGDTLKPGMRSIAVSRDLIDSGLTHNTKVWIEGLEGTYLVNDKMARRWTKKIDIHMGKSVDSAREWGKKTVTIRWIPENEETDDS